MKTPFNISLVISENTNVEAILNKLDELAEGLTARGFNTPSPSSASVASSNDKGPLVRHWCEKKGVSRVRCTDNRSPEEQAEYNLRHYLHYNDDQIDEIIANALIITNALNSLPVAETISENAPDNHIVEENDLY